MQIGDKIGRLTIKDIYKKKYRTCLCECDCGKIKEVIYSNIIKNTRSCGCIKKEQNIAYGLIKKDLTSIEDRRRKYIYAQYKSHAKYNNRQFTLTLNELDNLVFNNCHYCGQTPSNLVPQEKYGGPFYYNGIDRVNTKIDYIKENTVTCCIKCNRAKMDMEYNEFKEWIIKIYNNFITQ